MSSVFTGVFHSPQIRVRLYLPFGYSMLQEAYMVQKPKKTQFIRGLQGDDVGPN